MLRIPFYDPTKSYYENFDQGPFGAFADSEVFTNQDSPRYKFFGHDVFSSFGIPAGPLLNGRFVKAALDKGFDIPVYKTVRTRKYPCHPWPNVLAVKIDGDLTLGKAKEDLLAGGSYTEPLSITNSFGVPSYDPDFWQADLATAVAYVKPGQVVVGSFQGTTKDGGDVDDYIADFALGAKLLKETRVPVIEVNLSCPNEGTANLLCFDVERSLRVAETIKNEIGNIPLLLKLSYFEDDHLLLEFVKKLGQVADGFSTINTIAAPVVDREGKQALPGEGRLRSGVCGRAIKWAGLDMTKRLKKLREELNLTYTIIGVGGVTSPEDFLDYRQAGADAVMSATGAMWNPYLAQEIKNKL